MIQKRRAQEAFAEARDRAQRSFKERQEKIQEPAALTDEHFPELSRRINQGLIDVNNVMKQEQRDEREARRRDRGRAECKGAQDDVALLEEEELEQLVGATLEEVRMRVAMDSGSCANVAHPDDLPQDCIITPKAAGEKDFNGAGGDPIKKHGRVKTMMKGSRGYFTTDWNAAEVTRALHSVSTVCGPVDHPTGLQDVLFNNTDCYVVPPGVVRAIMKKIAAVAEYKREGGLYLADFTVSSFARQGRDQ